MTDEGLTNGQTILLPYKQTIFEFSVLDWKQPAVEAHVGKYHQKKLIPFDFEKTSHINLSCKLVPVQLWRKSLLRCVTLKWRTERRGLPRRVDRKRSYRSSFGKLSSSCTRINFKIVELKSNSFSFQWQNSMMTGVSVALPPPCWCPSKRHRHGVLIQAL